MAWADRADELLLLAQVAIGNEFTLLCMRRDGRFIREIDVASARTMLPCWGIEGE